MSDGHLGERRAPRRLAATFRTADLHVVEVRCSVKFSAGVHLKGRSRSRAPARQAAPARRARADPADAPRRSSSASRRSRTPSTRTPSIGRRGSEARGPRRAAVYVYSGPLPRGRPALAAQGRACYIVGDDPTLLTHDADAAATVHTVKLCRARMHILRGAP